MKDEPVILLLDDDDDDHHIFNLAARSPALNCKVYNASNAEQALHILKSVTPDFVFVDMHMPRIDGIEFLVRLKEIYNKFPFEVAMFSTGMTKELCEEATKKGATYCIRKSSSIDELVKVLMKLLIEKAPPQMSM
jgi:CheY-like chemotaxis protein